MKDTPLLMTPENAQKSHVGIKTETRRLNGLDAINASPNDWAVMAHLSASPWWSFVHKTKTVTHGGGIVSIKCPYGVPGDRLWFREAWQVDAPRDGTWADTQFYGCKGSPLSDIPERYQKPEHCLFRGGWTGTPLKWRSAMLMPKWACRTWATLTAVRVERLQDISQADAIAEGAPPSHPSIDKVSREFGYPDFSRSWYAQLCESINGAGSWDANPWVWVLEFKKVPKC